jgi:hypothetical protein
MSQALDFSAPIWFHCSPEILSDPWFEQVTPRPLKVRLQRLTEIDPAEQMTAAEIAAYEARAGHTPRCAN